jgi:hypothetical protein
MGSTHPVIQGPIVHTNTPLSVANAPQEHAEDDVNTPLSVPRGLPIAPEEAPLISQTTSTH